ncbi:ketopantoate reductase family protein [Variovorax sp. 2RAF20]
MNEKDILVWGAGAIGGTVGACLSKHGNRVTFVDVIDDHVAAICDSGHGLKISGPKGAFAVVAPAFTPSELEGKWNRIFLAVKAQDTTTACEALKPHLAEDGYVLSLQNGLCEKEISRIVGKSRTVGAFVNFGADWTGPGEIHFANHAAFVIGELDGSITPRLLQLESELRLFDPNVRVSADVWSYLWGKLAYGSLLMAQALGEKGIAECLARPELLEVWRSVAGEVVAVAEAEGVLLSGFDGFNPSAFSSLATAEEAAASVQAMVDFNRANAKTHSGVWRDLAIRRRRTEVGVLLGEVIEAGARHELPCPFLHKLVAMVTQIENGERVQSDQNLEELIPQ